MPYIPDKLTPVTPEDMAKAVSAAYKTVVGKLPTKGILQSLLTKIDHETAGGKSVHNFSIGNMRGIGSTGYWTSFAQKEYDAAGNPYTTPIDTSEASTNKTKAYLTLQDGAQDYIRVLMSRPNWWNGLQTGTLEGFVAGLAKKPMAYFTDDPARYLASMKTRFAKWEPYAAKYAGAAAGGIIAFVLLAVGSFFGARYLKG